MDKIIIVFMLFNCLVCLFSILMVVRDLVLERRAKATAAPVESTEVQPVIAEETVQNYATEPIVEPEQEVVKEETENKENEVAFSSAKETLEEKYLALESEFRLYYDEIVKYAYSREGSKRVKNSRYEEYKIGQTRLVRLLIKRGVVQCEFIMQNSSFKNYITENKISIKQAATVIKVLDPASVQVVKDSIDIVVKTAEEEKEYKKQLAREKRKARRQQSEEAATTEA